jgi:type I restriction enzyme S subunit
MDTAKFFEKFELFAHPEEAAKHFREVVLNLAFSGKLKGTDLSGWETHPIGDFFTEGLKSINAPDTPNQTYELWSVPSFETGAPEIVTGAQVGSTKRELRDGTILLGKINPHLNRIWVVSRRTNHPMIASQEWINITAGDTWDTGYLARLLSSPSFNRSICATAQGMGSLTRANTKQVAQILVHRPPLREQKKLIAKVDELMELCDRLEAQLKERDVKQAALAKAALAKFTEDPTPENLVLLFHPSFTIKPEDLLSVVLSIAVSGKLTGHDGIDSEIKTYKLGEVATFLGGYAFKSEWFSKGSGIRLVRNQNISHGTLNWSETEYLPASREAEFSKWSLRPGDLVISLNRPFISSGLKLAWVTSDDCPCLLVQRTMCLRTDPRRLVAGYLYLWLTAPHFRQGAHIVPSSGVPYIVPKKVASMTISLPSIDSQLASIRKVAELTKLIETYQAQLEASRTTGEKLLEAMVAELTAA